jgi:hypothetical protein
VLNKFSDAAGNVTAVKLPDVTQVLPKNDLVVSAETVKAGLGVQALFTQSVKSRASVLEVLPLMIIVPEFTVKIIFVLSPEVAAVPLTANVPVWV